MKFTVHVDIDRPRDEVIAKFDNTDNLFKWQQGLKAFEPVSGEPGQPGAKSRMVFDFKGREMELFETITVRNLPDEFSGYYDAPNVHNTVVTRFEELGPDKTRLISENEFQFKGFMRIMGWLMKSAFPKQSMKYLTDFKAFVEDGVDVNAPQEDPAAASS